MKKMRKVEIENVADQMMRNLICMHGLWNANKLSLVFRKKMRNYVQENPLPKKRKASS